jgi:hypothetical protein
MVGSLIKGKGKFVPVHTVKSYRESRGTMSVILNLGTRWRFGQLHTWTASIQGNNPSTH